MQEQRFPSPSTKTLYKEEKYREKAVARVHSEATSLTCKLGRYPFPSFKWNYEYVAEHFCSED